jgi:outer membrane lipoprotein-sorting protein
MTALAAVLFPALVLAAQPAGAPGESAQGSPVTADPGGLKAEEVMARVAMAESRMRDVTLDFTQSTTLKATADTTMVAGELKVLKSPGRFRLKYRHPGKQEAVFDGKSITLYLPEAGQAFRQGTTGGELSRVLGMDPSAPLASFSRGYRTSLVGCDRVSCVLSFESVRDPGMAWKVRVSASTWLMEEAVFENSEIRVNMSCANYRANRGLKASGFRLSLPKGTEVVDGLPQLFGGGAQ